VCALSVNFIAFRIRCYHGDVRCDQRNSVLTPSNCTKYVSLIYLLCLCPCYQFFKIISCATITAICWTIDSSVSQFRPAEAPMSHSYRGWCVYECELSYAIHSGLVSMNKELRIELNFPTAHICSSV